MPNLKTVTKEKVRNKFRDAILFVVKHANIECLPQTICLRDDYWLEKLDPYHRNMKYLTTNFEKWKNTNTKEDFFVWLDNEEANRTADTSNGSRDGVIYLTQIEAEKKYKVNYTPVKNTDPIDMYIADQQGTPVCTKDYGGKMPGRAAYIINAKKAMLLAEHKLGVIQHSTLGGSGAPVVCAGEIGLDKNGKIISINNASGHYRPTLLNFYLAIKSIPEECFAKNTIISFMQSSRDLNPISKPFTANSKAEFLTIAEAALKQKNIRTNIHIFFQRPNLQNTTSKQLIFTTTKAKLGL